MFHSSSLHRLHRRALSGLDAQGDLAFLGDVRNEVGRKFITHFAQVTLDQDQRALSADGIHGNEGVVRKYYIHLSIANKISLSH